eukprot:scaffold36618_cov59-Phaeocystis_antarctica.AAC.1
MAGLSALSAAATGRRGATTRRRTSPAPRVFYNAYAGKAFSSTAYGGDYLAVCKGGTAFPSPPPQ